MGSRRSIGGSELRGRYVVICLLELAVVPVGRGRGLETSAQVVTLFVIWRHRYGLDEAVSSDAIVIAAIQDRLKPWQVLVVDVEPAVLIDPVGKRVDADESHILCVHIGKDTLTIQHQLIALSTYVGVSLNDNAKRLSQLLHPSTLEEVNLLERQIVVGFSWLAGSLGLKGRAPLLIIDRAVIRRVNAIKKSRNIVDLDSLFSEDLGELLSRDSSVLVDVKQAERLFEREGLVCDEGRSGVLQEPISLDQHLDHSEEHEVLNLALLLKLLGPLLGLERPILALVQLPLDLGSLLSGQALFLLSLLLALSRREIVVLITAAPS